jgi:hypothetical protein
MTDDWRYHPWTHGLLYGWQRFWLTFTLPWPTVLGFALASFVAGVAYAIALDVVRACWTWVR